MLHRKQQLLLTTIDEEEKITIAVILISRNKSCVPVLFLDPKNPRELLVNAEQAWQKSRS